VRRSEKEITDRREIDRIIQEAHVCRLGLRDENEVYIVPLSFGYDPSGTGTFYFHSAAAGRKIDLIRTMDRDTDTVSFEIDRMVQVTSMNEEKACTWSMNYESVMGYGTLSVLESAAEKTAALQILMAHYAGTRKFTFPDAMVQKTVVLQLNVTRMTAKHSLRAEA